MLRFSNHVYSKRERIDTTYAGMHTKQVLEYCSTFFHFNTHFNKLALIQNHLQNQKTTFDTYSFVICKRDEIDEKHCGYKRAITYLKHGYH